MAAKPTNPPVLCPNYTWRLRQRDGVWFADGRSRTPCLGRHSLNTRDREEAMRQLAELDLRMAIQHGKASPSALAPTATSPLELDAGRKLYLEHVGRPPTLGGATDESVKRYRAVFDKLISYLRGRGIAHWNGVNSKVVTAYIDQLDAADYSRFTTAMESTLIKQFFKWCVEEELLPASSRLKMRVDRPEKSDRYCWRPEEVRAMLDHCFDPARPELRWLGHVLLALANTGLRSGELEQLHWTDVDLRGGVLRVVDRRGGEVRSKRGEARSTKGGRGREVPLNETMLSALGGMPRHADGRVFRAAGGGPLDAGRVLTALKRHVLTPLKSRFPKPHAGERGFEDGVVHSFRHYFASTAANEGTALPMLQAWLGHRDAEMVARYYHLPGEQSRRQMEKLNGNFAGGADATWRRSIPPVESEGSPPGQDDVLGTT